MRFFNLHHDNIESCLKMQVSPMSHSHTFSETKRIDISGPVSTARIFFKGAFRSLFRSQGNIANPPPKQLVTEMKGVRPHPTKVQLFRSVCGYEAANKFLPLSFPETLFLAPLGRMVTSRHFPLSPIGLIHVRQSITQYRPLYENALFDLCCRMTRLSQTERGLWLNVVLEARIEENLVWEGTATFLSRSRELLKAKRKTPPSQPEAPPAGAIQIDVPETTGRRYAKASGDYNPHHLYRMTAKPLGYKRPIAHGMWSLARCLAEIQPTTTVRWPFSVNAEFKLPIYMPATISLNCKRKDNTTIFELFDTKKGFPHLKGIITGDGN